jgi:hypothetical protein
MGDEIKPNEMGGHVTYLKEKKHTRGFRWGSLRGRDQVEDLGIDRRIISIQILRNMMGRHGLDLSGLG